jgi:hypothetical protein
MPESESPKKRPQRRRRRQPATQQSTRATSPQNITIIDAVSAKQHREHERHHLPARIRSTRPITTKRHEPAHQLLDPESPRERRNERDPRVRNHPLIVKDDPHPVQSDRRVILHHTSDLLIPGRDSRNLSLPSPIQEVILCSPPDNTGGSRLSATPKPDSGAHIAEPKELGSVPAEKEPTKTKPRPKPSKPPKPFKDLRLDQLGAKTQALLREFQSIDPDKLPNTAAVVTRAMLELAVDEFISKQGLHAHQELRKRVETCLKRVDPSYKASEYQGLRTGLQDGTSLYAVATLHGFVHNPHYHADGMTVRSIAANIEPFLQAMNDSV